MNPQELLEEAEATLGKIEAVIEELEDELKARKRERAMLVAALNKLRRLQGRPIIRGRGHGGTK